MVSPVSALLGFGSNLGDRRRNIQEASNLLLDAPENLSLRLSTIRQTQAVGTLEAPAQGGPYLNAVGELMTLLDPADLLRLCLSIEEKLGRRRSVPNAARSIDLDLLFWGDAVLSLKQADDGIALELPHPRAQERGFVMEPLAELQPERRHPITGRSFSEHWAELRTRVDGPTGTGKEAR